MTMEPKRKKVLYIITKSNWGGAQRYVFELASAFTKDADVAVALGGTGAAGAAQGTLATRLAAAGIRTIFVESFMRDISISRELKTFVSLVTLLRNERPDIVHLNSSKAGGLGALAARLAGIKTIVFTVHGLPYDEDRRALHRALIWCATWFTFLLCHKVIVLSKNDLGRAKRLPFAARKIHLVYNGIDPAIALETKTQARTRLGIEAAAGPVIGTIAEFTKNKGLPYLVRAFVTFRQEQPRATLCLIGDGELRPSIERFVKDHDLSRAIILPGFVAQAERYLSAFDIFVLPSIKEGLPYVLLEAGLAGLPLVATAVGGVSEVITDMESGIVIKPFQEKEIRSALQFLAENPEKSRSFGEKITAAITSKFSLKEMRQKTAALYGV